MTSLQSTIARKTASKPLNDSDYLIERFEGLTDEMVSVTPSQWAEANRYLPPSVTPMPGYYRYEIAPYLREIADCMGLDSPVREVAVMKGVQIGVTVGCIENSFGYYIEHGKNVPVLLLTATSDLAKIRMEQYITPMLQHSGLMHLIRSNDESTNRKQGKTEKKIEWFGGGFGLFLGVQNPAMLRSFSSQVVFCDEVDGWPRTLGQDGDPLGLARSRANSFEESRKILFISSPTETDDSLIYPEYLDGDQRKYFVCCRKCGFAQELRWHVERKDGRKAGMQWEMRDGRLEPGTVRWHCAECLHPHLNDDKIQLLSEACGAHWVPTVTSKHPWKRSYHIPAMLSPVGMQSWEACVNVYLAGWDYANARMKDPAKYQVYQNNILGLPYKEHGSRIRFEQASAHRREVYRRGEIPNEWAKQVCGSPVLLLTCAVDVNGDNLAVAVFGWCRELRPILIDYFRFEGTPDRSDDPKTWGALAELIEQREYVADDGKAYRIALTVIDSSYNTDVVTQFTNDYEAGVFAIRGRQQPVNGSFHEFSEFLSKSGTLSFFITVDLYKDRWAAALRKHWHGDGEQPYIFFNAPANLLDKELKELTVEYKVIVTDEKTGKPKGHLWKRPPKSDNELWDLLMYANGAHDMLAKEYCDSLLLDRVDFELFWAMCEESKPPPYFYKVKQ